MPGPIAQPDLSPPVVNGTTDNPTAIGVLGQNNQGGTAVLGSSIGVGHGFLGGKDPQFHQHAGVYGESDQQGVMGLTTVPKGTGVYGGGTTAAKGDQIGVRGETTTGVGVLGKSTDWQGVSGQSTNQAGVVGISTNFVGVWGESQNADQPGVFGKGPGLAGRFSGNVEVSGNLNMTSPKSDIILGDVAEGFGTQDGEIIEPGTVVVLNQDGLVCPGDHAYDKKVAGVVSGAGDYRPAIVLDKQRSQASRLPVALMGKVCCKVDASYSPIEVGDLLTTSPTPGHAIEGCRSSQGFWIGDRQGTAPAERRSRHDSHPDCIAVRRPITSRNKGIGHV